MPWVTKIKIAKRPTTARGRSASWLGRAERVLDFAAPIPGESVRPLHSADGRPWFDPLVDPDSPSWSESLPCPGGRLPGSAAPRYFVVLKTSRSGDELRPFASVVYPNLARCPELSPCRGQ